MACYGFPMGVDEHRAQSSASWGFAVLTVSDTRTERDDRGGRLVREMASSSGHREFAYAIVPDEVAEIGAKVAEFIAMTSVDVVLVTGGTGFSPRDRTLEALAPLFDRPIEGFGELFRMLSWEQVGAAAMLSRATAGVVGKRLLFLLPGSPKAVELALSKLILPEAAHLLGQIRKVE